MKTIDVPVTIKEAIPEVTEVVDCDEGLPWGPWWQAVLDGTSGTSMADRMMRTADSRRIWGRLSAACVRSAGSPPRVIMQVEDVTDRRQAELELANKALHDALTGAPDSRLPGRSRTMSSAITTRTGSHLPR